MSLEQLTQTPDAVGKALIDLWTHGQHAPICRKTAVAYQRPVTTSFRDQIVRKALVQFSTDFAAVKRAIQDVPWIRVIQVPLTFDLDGLIDLLGENQKAFGQRLVSIAKEIAAIDDDFWDYLNVLLDGSRVFERAQVGQDTLFAAPPGRKSVFKNAIRIGGAELLDLANTLRDALLDASRNGSSYVMTLFSVAAQSGNTQAFKDGVYMMLGVVDLVNAVDPDVVLPFEAALNAYGKRVGQGIARLGDANRSLRDDFASHWMNAGLVLMSPALDTFDVAKTASVFIGDLMQRQVSARMVWASNAPTHGAFFQEVYGAFFDRAQDVVSKNLDMYNHPIEVLNVAQGIDNKTPEFERAIGVAKQYLKGLALNNSKRGNALIGQELSDLVSQIMIRGYADQDRIEAYYKLMVGDDNVIRFSNQWENVRQNLEFHIGRSFFAALGEVDDDAPIGNDLEDIVREQEEVARKLTNTQRLVEEKLRTDWGKSPNEFRVMLDQFKERIGARLGKLEDTDNIASKRVVKIMMKSIKSIRKDRDLSKGFAKVLVRMILQVYQLEQLGNQRQALLDQVQRELEEAQQLEASQEEWRKSVRSTASAASMLIISGITGYLVYSQWDAIAAAAAEEETGWMSYMPRFIQKFRRVRVRDISPTQLYGTIRAAMTGNWVSSFGAGMQLGKIAMEGLLGYTVGRALLATSWAALDMFTVPMFEKLFVRHNVSIRHSFAEQLDQFRLTVRVELGSLVDMIRTQIGLNREAVRQRIMAGMQAGAAIASGNVALAAGIAGRAAIQQDPNVLTRRLFPGAQRGPMVDQLELQTNRQRDVVTPYQRLVQDFDQTIQRQHNVELEVQQRMYRQQNALPAPAPETQAVTVYRFAEERGDRPRVEEVDDQDMDEEGDNDEFQ